jgi:hypothetical protein
MRGSEPGMFLRIISLDGEAHLTHQDSVRHWEAPDPGQRGETRRAQLPIRGASGFLRTLAISRRLRAALQRVTLLQGALFGEALEWGVR